jgi:hypothetical protein
MTMESIYFDDFMLFTQYMIEQRDPDPTYEVLRARFDNIPDHEEQLWYVLIYVAWYNLANGEWFWQQTHDDPSKMLNYSADHLMEYPTGTPRRNLRGGVNMRAHVRSLLDLREKYGSFRSWLTHEFTTDEDLNTRIVYSAIKEAWGNGTWAAYKIAEILNKVLGYPVRISDMGGSNGDLVAATPKKGLELLYGTLRTAKEFRDASFDIFGKQSFTNDIAVLESVISEFYKCATGRSYVGLVTDVILQAINDIPHGREEVRPVLYEARKRVLPNYGLGELNGWDGVDKNRSLLYYYTKKILRRIEPMPDVLTWPSEPWNVPFNWR